ncbi:MAG: glycosyltransferase [Patescibacteria group bacterium]
MDNSHNPLVSIIVATKNEQARLPHLCLSIAKQNYTNIETIIVDNYSTDDTLILAKRFTQKVYLHGTERSQQRNYGAKKSEGKYLLYLDADMELHPGTVGECIEVISRQNSQALIIPETNNGTNFFSRIKRLEKKLYLNESSIESPRFFSKKIFMQVGGYDERLIAGEDWDLGKRVSIQGKISRINRPLVHNENSFFREIEHKLYYTKHIAKYHKKHQAVFSEQSGFKRLFIFLTKKTFYTEDPPASIGLLFVKSIEFFLYCLARLYASI